MKVHPPHPRPAAASTLGSLAIVLGVAWIVSAQVWEEVTWGAGAAHQRAAPSVRRERRLSLQQPAVCHRSAAGLGGCADELPQARVVYSSGFDASSGSYRVVNPRRSIDLVFVFPVQLARRVLLSDLTFRVDGNPVAVELAEGDDKLVWTGRLGRTESRSFEIGFRGRGLDAFSYVPDPALPVRNLELRIAVAGGENYDYGVGVVPASQTRVERDAAELTWTYASLESGVPMGVSFLGQSSVLTRDVVRRAWAPARSCSRRRSGSLHTHDGPSPSTGAT
jgi:hypothetical protein